MKAYDREQAMRNTGEWVHAEGRGALILVALRHYAMFMGVHAECMTPDSILAAKLARQEAARLTQTATELQELLDEAL
jgi:hypothetical protein